MMYAAQTVGEDCFPGQTSRASLGLKRMKKEGSKEGRKKKKKNKKQKK